MREGKNLKGRFLELVFRAVGKRPLQEAFANSVKAIEARHYETRATESDTPATAIAA